MFSNPRRSMLSLPNYLVRSIVACLLLAIGLLAFGVPISIPVEKDIRQRFPCEARPCGCDSAAKCWEKCCCHTDEQKIAWAEKNGVEPPSFLVERVASSRKSSVSKAVASAQTTSKPTCCSSAATKKKPACCSTSPEHESDVLTSSTRSCCNSVAATQNDNDVKPEVTNKYKRTKRTKLVLLTSIADCNGLAMCIEVLTNCLPTQSASKSNDSKPLVYTLLLHDEFFLNPPDQVDGPVPRIADCVRL